MERFTRHTPLVLGSIIFSDGTEKQFLARTRGEALLKVRELLSIEKLNRFNFKTTGARTVVLGKKIIYPHIRGKRNYWKRNACIQDWPFA